jgi:hypothetical protein
MTFDQHIAAALRRLDLIDTLPDQRFPDPAEQLLVELEAEVAALQQALPTMRNMCPRLLSANRLHSRTRFPTSTRCACGQAPARQAEGCERLGDRDAERRQCVSVAYNVEER